jgi:hypothetical protein
MEIAQTSRATIQQTRGIIDLLDDRANSNERSSITLPKPLLEHW